jgi:PPOX class probable FMN-dependent enzyme
VPDDHRITSPEALRALFDAPSAMVQRKVIKRLDRHCRAIIGLSPFLCLSTASRDGRIDVSPRGDAPGFVQVLDDSTLFIPDRPGNNRIDSMTNLLDNPQIGLLFVVPGMDETLRVFGTAEITRASDLVARAAVAGKTPKLGLRVTVAGAHLHCGKAFKRARLWDPAAQIDRRTLPTLGRMALDQMGASDASADEADAHIEEGYRQLY